ncbi:thermonuclease family protein [Phnomibacter sp. MR]|uniref:thermonuclease family protein n=1 Tax=Phnomibacter sp. MR TaxID=3042318 RepID=UPI003A804C3E
MKPKIVFIFIISALGCNHPESENYDRHKSHEVAFNDVRSHEENQLGYKVIGIKDGDTFVLLIDGKEQIVRLAHIDCPEKKQPFGNNAKQFASDLCFGMNVTLIHNNKYDRNKRLISEIILLDGTNVNQELVRNGLAWHFKKYSDSKVYVQLEIEAKQNKVGLWIEPNPIAPWNWRKK